MSIAKSRPSVAKAPRTTRIRPRLSFGRKVRLLILVNLVSFSALMLVGEVGIRLFWHPRFWVHAEGWLVGSGFGPSGKKWWPDSRFRIEGKEFFVRFRSDARGYRARPEPPRTADPCRVAFVGDSFVEAMQVDYDQSFVARLERGLTASAGGREVIGENYGVAGTGFFDYWHRITHDVFRPGVPAPEVLVLCVFPGNDFTDHCPDDGFDPDGRPLREYFHSPRWTWHALAWLGFKSKLAYFVCRSMHIAIQPTGLPQGNAPDSWWNDPAAAAAASESSAHVRHLRSLLHAIEEECGRHGTRLVLLIVPVNHYNGKGDQSPLARIFSDWGVKAPVIDVAAAANATAHPARLVFPLDGHLNPSGHEFVTAQALGPLGEALRSTNPSPSGSDGK